MEALQRNAPRRLSEFVGNAAATLAGKAQLSKWPFQFCIVGPSGCGKSTFCELLMSDHSWDILRIKSTAIDDVKGLVKLIDNFVSHRSIESFMCKKQKVVFLDDVDMLMCADRGVSSAIMTFVNDHRKVDKVDKVDKSTVSIIMTCSVSEERKLSDLKKKIDIIRLYNPSPKDALVRVINVLDKEGLAYDAAKVLKLAEAHGGNIRGIMMNLHLLDDDGALTDEKRQKLMFDTTPFEMTRRMLTLPCRTKDMRAISDNNLVPLLMYENYPTELFSNRMKQSRSKYYEMVSTILDRTVHAEALERYMFCNTDWDLWEPVSILKCGSINMILNTIDRKKSRKDDNLQFTQALTKSATRHNYNRRLMDYKEELGVRDILGVYKAFESGNLECDAAIATYMSQVRKVETKAVKRPSKKKTNAGKQL